MSKQNNKKPLRHGETEKHRDDYSKIHKVSLDTKAFAELPND